MSIITSSTIPLSAYPVVQKVITMMQKDFAFPLKDRLVVIPEVEKFRIKEDESITNQVKTGKFEYDVHFDGEYVCAFNMMDHPQRVRIEIFKGLKRLIKDNKIFWNPEMYKVKEVEAKETKKQKKQRLETIAKKFKSPEEKLVVEAIEKHVK